MKIQQTKHSKKTSDASVILDRMTGNDPDVARLVDEARTNAEVAQLIYAARTKANLTQKELAKLVGTTQSVIARLEDADYEGHSLSMLNRIAAAMERRVEVRFVSLSKLQPA